MKLLKFIGQAPVAAICFAVLLLGNAPAFAQVSGGNNASGMNTVIVKLFGNHTNFISRVETRVLDKNQQETSSVPMSFEISGANIRMDVNLTQVKSKNMPPNLAVTMKQMGMDQMTTILLPEKKSILAIYPNLKSYAQMPMSKEDAEAAAKTFKIEKTRLGKETIDAHPCEKNSVTLTDDKGGKQKAIVWNATDLKGFPVQVQLSDDDSTLVMKFKDVKFGQPAPGHFEPPAGYLKYDNINTMMADAVGRKMNPGGAKQ